MSAEAARRFGGPTSAVGLLDAFVEGHTSAGRARMAWWETRVWLAADPALFALLRATGRRSVVPLGRFGTVINDPAVGRAILAEPLRFQSVGPGTHGELMNSVLGSNALINMDGPSHEAMRRALADLFAAGPAARIAEDASAALLADAAERLRSGGIVDVVRLVRVMTGRAAMAALGVPDPPDGERGYLRAYAMGEELLAMMAEAARRGIRPAEMERARGFVAALIVRARPGWDDPTSLDAVLPRLRAAGVDEASALAVAVTVMVASTETLGSGLPRAVALLIDSGQWRRLRTGDPEQLEQAIDACLRLVTPTAIILRSSTSSTDVGGRRFRPGERVLISVYGMTRWRGHAARDPETLRIDEPVDREIRHLWFGAGPHFCIGNALARAQMRNVLGALREVGPLTIVRRRPSRHVLFPSYRELVIRKA